MFHCQDLANLAQLLCSRQITLNTKIRKDGMDPGDIAVPRVPSLAVSSVLKAYRNVPRLLACMWL